MRTIKQNIFKRLEAQTQEAEVRGLDKLAENLTTQLVKNAANVRSDGEPYSYSASDFRADVENDLWDIVIRAADFYNIAPDAAKIQNLITKAASDLITDLSTELGATVGAYEPHVMGEEREVLAFEVE